MHLGVGDLLNTSENLEIMKQSMMRYCIPEFNEYGFHWKLNIYSATYSSWFTITQINLDDFLATLKLVTCMERMGSMYLGELFAVCESEGCNFIVYDNEKQCEFCLYNKDEF